MNQNTVKFPKIKTRGLEVNGEDIIDLINQKEDQLSPNSLQYIETKKGSTKVLREDGEFVEIQGSSGSNEIFRSMDWVLQDLEFEIEPKEEQLLLKFTWDEGARLPINIYRSTEEIILEELDLSDLSNELEFIDTTEGSSYLDEDLSDEESYWYLLELEKGYVLIDSQQPLEKLYPVIQIQTPNGGMQHRQTSRAKLGEFNQDKNGEWYYVQEQYGFQKMKDIVALYDDEQYLNDPHTLVEITDKNNVTKQIPQNNIVITYYDVFQGLFSNLQNFNQYVGNLDIGSKTTIQGMFNNSTAFNQDISGWDLSNVTDIRAAFYKTEFNQDISSWDVSNVTTMEDVFSYQESFNQDISGWDVSNVTNMGGMFHLQTEFNQDISSWDVSNVTDMGGMFTGQTQFNQDISGWNVSNVTNFIAMFQSQYDFNQDISGWDVSKATIMDSMFQNQTSFNQDLSSWCVETILEEPGSFSANTPNWDKEDRMPKWGEPCQ